MFFTIPTPNNPVDAQAQALRYERALQLLDPTSGYRFVIDEVFPQVFIFKPGNTGKRFDYCADALNGCDCPDGLKGFCCKHYMAGYILEAKREEH